MLVIFLNLHLLSLEYSLFLMLGSNFLGSIRKSILNSCLFLIRVLNCFCFRKFFGLACALLTKL